MFIRLRDGVRASTNGALEGIDVPDTLLESIFQRIGTGEVHLSESFVANVFANFILNNVHLALGVQQVSWKLNSNITVEEMAQRTRGAVKNILMPVSLLKFDQSYEIGRTARDLPEGMNELTEYHPEFFVVDKNGGLSLREIPDSTGLGCPGLKWIPRISKTVFELSQKSIWEPKLASVQNYSEKKIG